MTIIDLFNRALGMIGHDRTIPAGDDTAATPTTEYVRCNQEWDGARIAILSAHAWNWLVSETPLIQGAEGTGEYADVHEYVYDRPDDLIRLVAVLDGYNRRVDYRTANGQIFTTAPEAKFRYLADTEVIDDWPQHVVDAVAAELAARIGLAMSANGKVVQAMKALQTNYLAMATEHDSTEQNRAGTSGDKYVASRR